MAYAVIERDADLTSRYEHIVLSAARIDNYFAPIPVTFFQRKAEEIWKIVFNGATALGNVISALKYLVNLETIEFRNTSLDQYHPVPLPHSGKIDAPGVVQLKFTSSCASTNLTQSEYLIFDFLNKWVRFPSLTSIEIGDTSRSRSRWRRTPAYHPDLLNEGLARFCSLPPPSSLPLFLASTAATLQDVKLGRLQFQIMNLNEISEDMVTSLDQIQLKILQFRVDSTGVDHVLKVQTRLENLTCDDTEFDSDPIDPHSHVALCNAFAQCVGNCTSTLWSVRVSRLLPLLEQCESAVSFDLAVFRNCANMRYLSIDNQNLKYSTFSNGHALPISLTSLTLRVHRVTDDELVLLTSRIQHLVNLSQLTLSATAEYQVKFPSLRNILQATTNAGNTVNLHDVELKNARLPEDMTARQLQDLLCQADYPENRYWTCEIRPLGIVFEKCVTQERN